MNRSVVFLITFSVLILFITLLYSYTIQGTENVDSNGLTTPINNSKSSLDISSEKIENNSIENKIIKGEEINHTAYSLLYSEEAEQPFWVNYTITRVMLENPICKRKDNFRPDPLVSTFSAHPNDYKGSGFDRGHLCPAKDMEFSEVAMSESFYMSNMSPQHPSLNRGIWKRLEANVRKWTIEKDSISVYCGGLLDSISEFIGDNKVAVPKYYYKAILSINDKEGIAFVFPNKKCDANMIDYAISIDSLEQLTHFNIFPEYDENNNFESTYNSDYWFK